MQGTVVIQAAQGERCLSDAVSLFSFLFPSFPFYPDDCPTPTLSPASSPVPSTHSLHRGRSGSPYFLS